MGVAKTSEKVKERFYWLGLQENTEMLESRCPEGQKCSGPPKKYQHSLMNWQARYTFRHFGIDFMGPLPISNGNKHSLHRRSLQEIVRSNTITRLNSYQNRDCFS